MATHASSKRSLLNLHVRSTDMTARWSARARRSQQDFLRSTTRLPMQPSRSTPSILTRRHGGNSLVSTCRCSKSIVRVVVRVCPKVSRADRAALSVAKGLALQRAEWIALPQWLEHICTDQILIEIHTGFGKYPCEPGGAGTRLRQTPAPCSSHEHGPGCPSPW